MVRTPSGGSSASRLAARVAPVVVALAAAAVGAWMWARDQAAYDDAYIVYQYAQNWVDGNGIVFNAGERVEGYTNPLWVALSAAAIALGFDPYVAMSSLGVASYLALVAWIAFGLGRSAQALGYAGLGLVPALGCLVLPDGLAAMSGSGLETAFIALCLVGVGLLCLLPDDARWVRVLGPTLPLLAFMARFDAIVGVVAIALADGLRAKWSDPGAALRRLRWRVLPSVIGLVLLFAFRRAYYGEWLPNPYYAKGADQWHLAAGFAYLVTFAQSAWQLGPLVALNVFGLLSGHSAPVRRLCTYAMICGGGYAFYILKVGGDFMHYRFAWTPYLVLAMGGLAGLAELARRQQGLATVIAVAIAFLSLSPSVLEDDYTMQSVAIMDGYTRHGREVGTALRDHLPPETRIATTLAGTMSYYSRLPVVDQWGLNDYEVARGESLDRFQRGHFKPASISYLKRRGVEIVFGHPEICACDDLCLEPTTMLFLKLGENRCVRGYLLEPRRVLIERICAEPENFILHGVDCSKLDR